MSDTIPINITDSVAHTLFIPLFMRSLESRREDAILRDESACRIVDSVDFDFSLYAEHQRGQVGVCIRVRHFDEHARRFIEASRNPVIITLGCGLDDRSGRIGSDKAIFYNVDLPEVMDLRDRLLPPDEKNISIPTSMFDPAWVDVVKRAQPEADYMVIAEGVFIYFTVEEIRPVIESVARKLSPGELLFDSATSLGCRIARKNGMLKLTKAPFRLELDDVTLPEQWMPNLHLEETAYYMDQEKARWDRMARIMSLLPFLTKAFKMLRFRVSPIRG